MTDHPLPAIGKVATRALANHGLTRLDQCAGVSRAELMAMHGVGPKAVRNIDEALVSAELAPLSP